MKTITTVLITLIVIIGGYFLYQRFDTDNGATDTPAGNTTGGAVTGGTNTGTTNPPAGTGGNTGGNTNTGGSSGTTTVSTNDIKITSPKSGQAVSSPLTLTGQARGNWFFEASAPVRLVDAAGKLLAQGHIQATGDWMTTNFVPFTGMLVWSATSTGTSTAATLIFMNDNPSGLPSLQKSVSVPVVLSR